MKELLGEKDPTQLDLFKFDIDIRIFNQLKVGFLQLDEDNRGLVEADKFDQFLRGILPKDEVRNAVMKIITNPSG